MESKAKTSGGSDPTKSTHEQEIRNRAYEIYLQRGAESGYEVEDWLQAEREVTTQSSK